MNIMVVLQIAVGILAFAIIILLLIYFKMYMDEKNVQDKANKKESSDKDKKTKLSTGNYNKQSILNFMEFDKVEDNMIIQKNGDRYLMVIECQGINYDLMSRVEKTSVEDSFAQFLNTLRHPIQIYVQTRTINLESSIENYKQRVDDVKLELDNRDFQLKQMQQSGKYSKEQIDKKELEIIKQKNLFEYGKDIIYNTERMSSNKNVLRKNYYIIVPYYASDAGEDLYGKNEIRNIAFSELYTKSQSIIRTISACDISAKVLNSEEISDLLYNAYNRDEAEVYGINKAIRAKYDELYITAQDVIEKKMEALNEEINQKAIEKAKEAIDQVKSEKEIELKKKTRNLDEIIDEMAIKILNENKNYIGAETAEKAKKKINKKKTEKKEEVNVDVKK